jgi:quinol-cytochrome oxidoreductase complex cytochrome b subunit
METLLDIGAVILFLLIVPSVARAVRAEAKDEPVLATIVGFFVIIFGIVFMAAASQLASGPSSTQGTLLFFFVLIAIFARSAWVSKPAQ